MTSPRRRKVGLVQNSEEPQDLRDMQRGDTRKGQSRATVQGAVDQEKSISTKKKGIQSAEHYLVTR